MSNTADVIEISKKLKPLIETFSGIMFNVLHPNPDEISIIDLAHALGNQCRYGGHCRKFYSVAEHCVLVSRLVAAELGPINTRELELIVLMALLHDASEAYLVDIPTPVKNFLSNYRAIEGPLMDAIIRKFYLPFEFDKLPEAIHYADILALKLETEKLIHSKGKNWQMLKAFDEGDEDMNWVHRFKVKALRPTQAKRYFLMRFYELMGQKAYWKQAFLYTLGHVLPI